jgi:hypothetical protein
MLPQNSALMANPYPDVTKGLIKAGERLFIVARGANRLLIV